MKTGNVVGKTRPVLFLLECWPRGAAAKSRQAGQDLTRLRGAVAAPHDKVRALASLQRVDAVPQGPAVHDGDARAVGVANLGPVGRPENVVGFAFKLKTLSVLA